MSNVKKMFANLDTAEGAKSYEVEAPMDGDPIPAEVFTDDDLSADAKHVLMAVHGRPRSIKSPSLDWIMATCGFAPGRWQKTRLELIGKGWLIDERRNKGGKGKGCGFSYYRKFFRSPRGPL